MKFLKSLCLFSFFCISLHLSAQEIVFLRGNSYNVSLADTITHLTISVQPAKTMSLETIEVEIRDVKSDQEPDDINITAFTSSNIKEMDGKAFIIIDIDNSVPLKPGSYTLIMLFKNKAGSNATIQKSEIVITINAAIIKPLATVVVERKDPFFFMDYKSTGAILPIHESGRKTSLSGIYALNHGIIDAAGRRVPANIHVRPGVVIPPNGVGNLEFEIQGKLPIGKVTANLEIFASQLTDPVPVRLEITTRKGIYLLIVFIVLGLCLGYLIRVYLESKIKLSTARLGGIEFLQTIAGEIEKRPDELFRTKMNEIQIRLNRVRKRSNDEEITNAINSAKDDLKQAITEYDAGRTQINIQLESMDYLLNIATLLPPEFNGLVGNSGEQLELAFEANNKGNVTVAKGILAKVVTGLNERLMTPLKLYRQQMIGSIVRLQNTSFKLSEKEEENQSELVRQLEELQVSIPQPVAIDILQKIIDIDFKIGELIPRTCRLVENKLIDVFEVLDQKDVALVNPTAVEELKKKENEVLCKAADKSTDAREVLNALPGDLDNLYRLMKTAIISQTRLTNEAQDKVEENKIQREAISENIKNGFYVEAAEKAIDFIKRNTTRTYDVVPAPHFTFTKRAMVSFNHLDPSPVKTITLKHNNLTDISAELENDYRLTRTSIIHAKFWQTVVAGLVIILIGCILYADKFMGTPADLGTVFLWAFVLDISVATLATLTGKVVK